METDQMRRCLPYTFSKNRRTALIGFGGFDGAGGFGGFEDIFSSFFGVSKI